MELRRARRAGIRWLVVLTITVALLWPAAPPGGFARAATPGLSKDKLSARAADCHEGASTAVLEVSPDGSLGGWWDLAGPSASPNPARAPALAQGEPHDVDRLPGNSTVMELDPATWEDFSYWDLNTFFKCDTVFAGTLRIYDAAAWDRLRRFYHSFIFHDERENPRYDGEPDRTYQISNNETFAQPTTPFHAGGKKGRGLKAARDLREGEVVFQATNNTVVFADGATWRAFLFAIHDNYDGSEAAQTTCDILVWSWVQDLGEGPAIVIDLDNGSLLNQGRDGPGWEPLNVRCGRGDDDACGMTYYTTRDVREGEELLADYREFAMKSWGRMQL